MESPGRGASLSERERTIETLCEAFANDELEVEEFERRVEVAHGAKSMEELRRLLAGLSRSDLPARSCDEPRPAPPRPPTQPSPHVRQWSFSVGILGGASRRGSWTPGRRNLAVGLLGGCLLDLRDAVMPPGVTEVFAIAVMGGVEIIVPPGLRVETSGLGIMGGFDHRQDAPYPTDLDAPVLRVSGIALMGGVDVKVRLPGESSREARRRAKEARRRLHAGEDQGITPEE